MRIFVAGATGALGRQLVPLLRAAGHSVVASTRSAAKTASAMTDHPDVIALRPACAAARCPW
ncbi:MULTISPECIES: NAD-dependent epimerase/dehydratase family protein [unclassified Bradyrhizobium]